MRTLIPLVLVSLLLHLVACDDDTADASSPTDASTSLDGATDAAPFDAAACAYDSKNCPDCAPGTEALINQTCEPSGYTCWTPCTDGYHRRLGCSDGVWGGEKGQQVCGDPLDASTDASN